MIVSQCAKQLRSIGPVRLQNSAGAFKRLGSVMGTPYNKGCSTWDVLEGPHFWKSARCSAASFNLDVTFSVQNGRVNNRETQRSG